MLKTQNLVLIPFLKAVELLKVRREECIIIENAILGVEAAKKAEIYCIGVPTYLEPSQLDRADLVVGDHKKLMEHLLSLEPAQVQDMKMFMSFIFFKKEICGP